MIKVAAFTGGRNLPSARFRLRQYIAKLACDGIDVTEYWAPLGMYPPRDLWMRPLWGTATLATRLPGIMNSYRHDVTFLQREMLSTFATMERFTKSPRVLDVDDAIWLYREGQFAKSLARRCEKIICGNAFLAEYFEQWNSEVTVIPTAVDTNRYVPDAPADKPVIGWSGTSSGLKYLYAIESALATALRQVPGATLRIVCDAMPQFVTIDPDQVEYIRWAPQHEVSALQTMAVGIMPLANSAWERGKCSFKMLTYMACGVPVVASCVGMNLEVLAHGSIGFGARSDDEWIAALVSLLRDCAQRAEMGANARKVVVDQFSLDVVAPRLAQTLLETARSFRSIS